MRKWITFLMTFLVGSVTCANAYVDDSQFSFEAAYRHDTINWSADFPTDEPLYKANHKFKNLDIFLLAVNAKTNLGCNFYFRGTADWGWVLDGDTKETLEIHQSGANSDFSTFIGNSGSSNENIVDGRYVFDVSGAFGYPFYFCNCSMSLAPTIGYTFNEQNLWAETDTNFSIVERNDFLVPESGSEGCCRHKFVSRWYGPFIGLDWEYKPCGECWNLFAQLEYHWAQCNVKRNARLGFSGFDRFKSISHHAHGWVGAFGFNYDINHCWAVGLTAKFRRMVSSKNHHHDGSDSSFSSFVSSDASSKIKTHVHWNSYEIGVEVVRAF